MLHILDYIFVDVAAQGVRSDTLSGSFSWETGTPADKLRRY
jgi:hypothetical protein